MTKPLDQFGGWLKFFYIMQWVTIILETIFTLLFAFFIFRTENTDRIIELISFLDVLIAVILYIKIVNITRKRATYIPSRIIQLMTWVLIFAGIFAVGEGLLYYLTLGIEGLPNLVETGIRGFGRILIWYFIWTEYFKESKRVLAYYGKNAKK